MFERIQSWHNSKFLNNFSVSIILKRLYLLLNKLITGSIQRGHLPYSRFNESDVEVLLLKSLMLSTISGSFGEVNVSGSTSNGSVPVRWSSGVLSASNTSSYSGVTGLADARGRWAVKWRKVKPNRLLIMMMMTLTLSDDHTIQNALPFTDWLTWIEVDGCRGSGQWTRSCVRTQICRKIRRLGQRYFRVDALVVDDNVSAVSFAVVVLLVARAL